MRAGRADRAPRLSLRAIAPATWFRLGLTLVSLAAAATDAFWLAALPFALALVTLELLGERRPRWTTPGYVLFAETGTVCLAVAVLAQTPTVLPLLLVPAFRAGEQHGRLAAAAVPLVLGAATLVTLLSNAGTLPPVVVIQWWLLAVGIAQLGAWHRRAGLAEDLHSGALAAREAGHLLGRLQGIARRLPTGLDVPAIAQLLLDEVARVAPADRAAVLVRVGDDDVSPVAVRGVARVPWRDPVRSPGTAHTAWTTGRLVHDVRTGDADGRRRGSAMLAVPVANRDDELLGLLVLERLGTAAFTPAEVEAVQVQVRRMAAHLHAALAFTELRHISEVAERERLAREMHDGVAQDLAALGYALDAASRRVAPLDEAATQALREARAELNRTLRDLRLSISDLRSTVSPDRGLGAAIASHVQALGTSRDVTVTIGLQESAFRLPGHHESALLRLTQDFLADARTRRTVTELSVELESHAPTARLLLRRDGGGGWEPDPQLVHVLGAMGGSLRVGEDGGTVTARILLGTPATGPRPLRAGGPASLEVVA